METQPAVDVRRRAAVTPCGHDLIGPFDTPGRATTVCDDDGSFFLIHACPGCGRVAALPCNQPPGCSPNWDAAGDPSDPATLTLTPSINCVGCCGWHGYLRDGVFAPC